MDFWSLGNILDAWRRLNDFQRCGDIAHMCAIIIMFVQILRLKSNNGISIKTQIMLCTAFVVRYMDILESPSMYHFMLKIIFMLSSLGTIALLYAKFWKSQKHDWSHDVVRIEYLLVTSFVLGMVMNYEFTFIEIAWSSSLFLEALAIIPQLWVIRRQQELGNIESVTWMYFFALLSYRVLYFINWLYKLEHSGKLDYISCIAGSVQIFLLITVLMMIMAHATNTKKQNISTVEDQSNKLLMNKNQQYKINIKNEQPSSILSLKY